MSAIVITPKSDNEIEFLSTLLKRLGVDSKVVSTEDIEDAGLLKMMKKADRSKKVSRDEVMKKLKG